MRVGTYMRTYPHGYEQIHSWKRVSNTVQDVVSAVCPALCESTDYTYFGLFFWVFTARLPDISFSAIVGLLGSPRPHTRTLTVAEAAACARTLPLL